MSYNMAYTDDFILKMKYKVLKDQLIFLNF